MYNRKISVPPLTSPAFSLPPNPLFPSSPHIYHSNSEIAFMQFNLSFMEYFSQVTAVINSDWLPTAGSVVDSKRTCFVLTLHPLVSQRQILLTRSEPPLPTPAALVLKQSICDEAPRQIGAAFAGQTEFRGSFLSY